MATEDDTEITVTFPKSVSLANYTGAYPVTFTLKKNESYVGLLRSADDPNNHDGLIGGKLISNKNVVVVSGSATGTNGLGRGHDYGIDQLVGTEKAGDAFIFIRGEAPASYTETENIILIPTSLNTTYSINGGASQTITGDYAIIEGGSYSPEGNMYVKTSAPVMAFQGISGVSTDPNNPEPNQGMFVVPALSCTSKGNINNIPYINKIGPNTQQGGIGIVAEKGKDVYVNGVRLTGKQNVTGNPNYVTYRISGMGDALYKVESMGELYVSYFTYSGAASSGAFYSGFQSPPEFTFDLDLVALGTCIENNLTLNATNVNTLDTYGWWYNPTSNADDTQWQELAAHANTTALNPQQIGWYQLRGAISCGGNNDTLQSQSVFVGNCPDDSDNDGVVDNLDLDEDNDGILDPLESGGDIVFDLSDPSNPVLPTTTQKNIPLPPSYTVSGHVILASGATLTGNNIGEITSALPASADAENSYQLTFSDPTNISIRIAALDAYVENETITISTDDAMKTISLLNLKDEVFVDTNYDGAFESGITTYTNSRLSFKYNPNSTSAPDVEIAGNGLTRITITHTLQNVTKNGTLKMAVGAYDYPIHTDGTSGDLLPDHLDLDSDNDGCYDVVEAGFEDPDEDGLVGISPIFYDPTVANSSADIRGRAVYTGYDFNQTPKDGDGNNIYDFQEVGTPATLNQDFALASATLCEGESLSLDIRSSDAQSVTWEVDSDQDGVFEPANALGTITKNNDKYSFLIHNVSAGLDQANFRARLTKNTYACSTDSRLFTLNVNANNTKPTLEPLTVVCDGATIADLGVPNVVWYETATGGSPLADDALLKHNTPYFAASVVNGCVGELRSETKVVVNNPIISTANGKTSFCAEEPVTLVLDTDKILPSPDDFARINNLIYIENALGPISYDNGYYYTQKGIKSGVQPMTWPTAKNLGESINGATMYIINSTTEENAVYQGLQYMGLTGNDGIAFWLGLFQDHNASDYNEPAGGWYWVDGTPLTYQNWYSGEPNDYPSNLVNGEEDYGQFEFGNNLIRWNDMSVTTPGGQSYPLFEYKAQTEIEWFTSEGGALTAVPNAGNSSEIVVNPSTTTAYVVKVTTNGVECYSDPFIITIYPVPVAHGVTNNQMEICIDDNNGAIASSSLSGPFDLTSSYDSIVGSQDVNTHTVAFYTSRSGAENNIAAAKILTPNSYTNTVNPQEVFYSVTNISTGCVSDVNSLMLLAQPFPPAITIPDMAACDDLVSGSDEDGILSFDLTTQTPTIETLLGSSAAYYISYHLNETDADANVPITEYTTVSSDNREKEIVVRIEDATTGCVRVDNRIKLIVSELPKIKEASFLREQCDTDTDGIVQDNLTLYRSFFSDNYQNETFTFYTDSSYTTPIPDPVMFSNTSMDQTVYVKITNNNYCERTFDPATGDPLTIDIRVRVSTINPSFLKTYYACLEQTNTANDGITTFDKSVFTDLQTALIAEHPAFANSNVSIQFFEREEDALFKINPIDTTVDYVNSTPHTQEIWAAVDANGFQKITCLGLKQVANLVVEPLPILYPVVIARQCDGDSPLDSNSQDGLFPFDTSTLLDQLLLTQNAADFEIVFYQKDPTDPSQEMVIATNSFPAVFESPSQTIRVKVANNPSNVNPPCYQESFIEFVVDETPQMGLVQIPELCDADDGIADGKASFDTSQLNAQLLLGQSNMEIAYIQRDGAGNDTALGTSLPNPFVTSTTTVIAQIFNPTNMACVVEQYITFKVHENPVFDLPQEQIFCKNQGYDTIYVTSPSATYDYAWTHNGVPISQMTQNLPITEGGTYSVTATNPVTGCTSTKTVEVDESEIASFSPDDILVFDLTGDQTNQIKIQTEHLGIGDYEFALNYGQYQDSPVFEDVPPGIHTVSVRDKKRCGLVRHQVSVIGYPFYFTPNNDGNNDTWQILGVSYSFQAESLIYIFDRHGRLMAEIAADGDGWDGTYNGTAMPADDYWFRVTLEDGRSFTGHFSLVR